MNTDTLLPIFVKKVHQLYKDVEKSTFLTDALKEIQKLENWLLTNRSLQQHRCLQSFLTYLWQSYGDDFKSRGGFVSYIKSCIGFCKTKKVKTVEIDSKCPECNCALKEKAYLKEFKVKSLSFAECSQKLHQQVFDRIKDFAFDKWGIVFEKWFEHWTMNEGTNQ